ncbi:response regulator transcription factor [Oleiagrimonas sp. MCCC 1A03011]|uniref:response regulator transcription factor n=1 Tax=Oleiagrimonas sp. MCCC 1A03011 TaxID=1926883 RepID=UPI000DC2C49A|nr:response regulator transcription factor [Oleiagrimonas sp. MCCC 1A03011]RAP56961.1 two-component system response regulator [Oleiagrimonas sp. MCCC 1A03011]
MRLLVVEDSPNLGRDLRESLARDGHAVDLAADGAQAQQFLASYAYDAVVLDLMMPRVDGWAVLRWLNGREPRPRVLVLSARDQVEDRIEALHLGADDYMVKPFSYEELTARLQALARRSVQSDPVLRLGAVEIDPRARQVRVDGEVLALTPKEYALLETLSTERGRVMTRTALFEHLYDARSESSDKVIEVLVSTLRGKLSKAGVTDLVQTRRGYGYVVE